jgi:hypothetical protein
LRPDDMLLSWGLSLAAAASGKVALSFTRGL